jgi:hypothetical protein
MLNAGAGRVDISPPAGVAHAGWGAQTHQVSLGNDMPLSVTAVVVANGDVELAIVDVDIGIFTVSQDQQIRERISEASGIPFGNIRLAYSHTHSGPITFGQWIKEGIELAEQWWSTIPEACVSAVAEAENLRRPARTGFGRGSCTVNINRRPARNNGELFTGRNWGGFVDHDVDVLGIDDADGNPIATIVNYAMHPTIMGHENQWVTPDFPGPMRSVVEHNVGGLCLFLQGASGNQGPVDGFTGDLRVYRKAGARLGAEAARVRLDIEPQEREERLDRILLSGADLGIYTDVPTGESDHTVAVHNLTVDLPCRDVASVKEARAAFDAGAKELETARASGVSEDEIQRAVSKVMRANIYLNVAKNSEAYVRDGYIAINIQSMRIGDTVLVSAPVEPFAELAEEIKSRSNARNTVFSGFSNGHYAYLTTDMAYEEGGYEVSVTPFAPGSSGLTIEACLEAVDVIS